MLLLAASCATACGSRSDDPARQTELASARVDAFSDFDRWARRAAAADSAFRNPVSFEETVFAPLRRNPEVCGAWVERKGSDPRTVSFPRTLALPVDVHWVRLRDERVAGLRSGTVTLPAPTARAPARSCVLLSREDGGPDGVVVGVTVAYVIAAPAAPP